MHARKHPALRWIAAGFCLIGAAITIDCGGDGGTSGASSGGDCGECFRPITCVKECGGEVLQSGCCPCPSGTMDEMNCGDAGH